MTEHEERETEDLEERETEDLDLEKRRTFASCMDSCVKDVTNADDKKRCEDECKAYPKRSYE